MKLLELEKNITEASALKPLNVKKIFVYKGMTLAIEVEQQGCLFAFDVTEFEEGFQVHLTSRNYHSFKKLRKFFSNVVKNRVLLETFACTADHSILLSLMDRTLKTMKTHYPYRVSVVVPVYNRTDLMYKCIESLLAQTIAKEDFEILFVDDHSSIDVKGYINKTVDALDPGGALNYRVLRRPMNSGGAGTPRNDGLIAAKGEFTFFLDSDDFVYPYCLAEAVSFGSINASDITYLKLGGSERNYGTRPFKNGNVAHAKLKEDHLLRSMHCFKLFRTSFLIDNRIFFPPGIKIGEDRLFMLHAISLAKGVSILGTKPYIHMTSHDGEQLTKGKKCLDEEFAILSQSLLLIRNLQNQQESPLPALFLNSMTEWIGHSVINRQYDRKWKVSHFMRLAELFSSMDFKLQDNCTYAENKVLKEEFLRRNFDAFEKACKIRFSKNPSTVQPIAIS